MTHLAILAVNQDEIEKIAEEHSGLMTKDQFIKMYKSIITKQPRNYLVIDYRSPVLERFKERFENVLPMLKNDAETSYPTKQNGSRSAKARYKGDGRGKGGSNAAGGSPHGSDGEENE